MKRILPTGFVDRMKAMGLDDVTEALQSTAPSLAIRLNPAKELESGHDGCRVAWNSHGRYLDERPPFTFDPALHQGAYYVQDASSMAIDAAVAAALNAVGPTDGPLRYLDACAAPGGKTTAAIDVLPAETFVVANEFDPRRASVLVENLAKWGHPAAVVRGDASVMKGMDSFFDIIAADMPCSGEGMMRKEEVAVSQWSPALIEECATRQRAIASRLWDCLAPGGALIYSTCTFNTAENEEIVQWLVDELGAEPLEIARLNSCPGVSGCIEPFSFPAYRFLPGRTKGEGLFMALLRKPLGEGSRRRLKPSKLKPVAAPNQYLSGDWAYYNNEGTLYAVPSAHRDLYAHVGANLNVIAQGIEIGQMKGRDIVPAQQLAMAVDLNSKAFPHHDVDSATALAYLRRETIVPNEAPRGIVLLTYRHLPLGFVKNLGNRANNLYPANWRIRSAIHP